MSVALIGSALVWTLGILLRDHLITSFCVATPTPCTAEHVPLIDRMSLGLDWSLADGLSYYLQNISIAAGPVVALSLAFFARSVAKPNRSMRAKLQQAGNDLLVWALCVLVNGALTEWVRITVSRARPFVYKDPMTLGALPAHYTSFYSGHTSFVAASWMALLWMTWLRTRNTAAQIAVILAAAILPALTGYFRIFSGRHFLSDTLAGAIMGAVVATILTLRTRKAS